jgi:formyl-CoA transferase
MTQPLDGIRVVDLTRSLAGPYCTMLLGDLGAEVIKIEQPGRGDESRQWGPPWAGGESAYFLGVNRNKRSMTLNLKSPQAEDIVFGLVERSDILVENFRAGTMERLGFGYERLKEVNPGLVYCSITGFGQEGPYKDRLGYDFTLEAHSGFMSITGEPDGEPMSFGVAILDIITGLHADYAIMAALRVREQTGQGQCIDMAMLDASVACLANRASNYLISGELPRRFGNGNPNLVPYDTVQARDRMIALGIGNDTQFRRFCEAAGCEQLADDPRFATNPKRVENRETLMPILNQIFGRRDADEWLELLVEADVPCAPVNTFDRVFSDPQLNYREMVTTVEHPTAGDFKMIASPLKLLSTPPSISRRPPLLGEHTRELLTTLLGYSDQDVEVLVAAGVV